MAKRLSDCGRGQRGGALPEVMKWIPLTQGKRTCVDDDVYGWVSQHTWCAMRVAHTFYAVRSVAIGEGKRRLVLLHRAITQTPEGKETNHIDGDGLNNLRTNLEIVSRGENQRAFNTRRKNKGKTSSFRGVSFHKRDRVWFARITFEYKWLHLGSFQSEEAAARARDLAARRLFGPRAQLNFPD